MIRPVILANCLVKKNNKYLLVQEATDKVYGSIKTPSKGKWTFPHGEVDEGEGIKDAAERELLEEAGGKTKIIRLGAIAQGLVDETVKLLSFVFYGEGFEKTSDRWKKEIKEIKWFTRGEIKDLEDRNLTRDQVPLSKIIEVVEDSSSVKFVDWLQPEYVKEIFANLDRR